MWREIPGFKFSSWAPEEWQSGISHDQPAANQLRLWLLFVAMIAIRFPALLRNADFYGEEAFHYQTALLRDFSDALTWSFAGYVSVFANTTALIAAQAPLDYGPTVMRLMSTLGPAALAAVVIASNTSTMRRSVATGLIVFTPLMMVEWATIIHAQFWFAAAMILMLGSQPSSRLQALCQYALAIVAGISSPLATVTAPFYAWKALRSRTLHPAILSLILGSAGLFQATQGVRRSASWEIDQFIAALFANNVNSAILGPSGSRLNAIIANNWSAWPLTIVISGALIVLIAVLCNAVHEQWRLAITAAVVIGLVATWFALRPYENMFQYGWGERYALSASISLLVILVLGGRFDSQRSLVLATIPITLAIWSGFTTGLDFFFQNQSRASTWRASVSNPGATAQVSASCKIALTEQPSESQFAISASPTGLNVKTFSFEPSDHQWFVLAREGSSFFRVLTTDGWSAPAIFLYGQENICFSGDLDVVEPADRVVRVDDSEFLIPSTVLDEFPGEPTEVLIAYSSDLAEALALGQFATFHGP